MGALEPINESITEDGRALAESLRTLFNSLEISVRRYAARCHTDAGNVSRYLSGKRVPPWSFIKELLANVAEHQGRQASDEAISALRSLHVRVLGTGNSTKRVLELQHLLEEADQQVLEAAALEKVLRQALRDQEQQVAQLNVELQSARAARAMDRQAGGAEIEIYSTLEDVRAERDQLRVEVDLLRRQLAEATAARILAEERCDQLERQIENAEKQEREAEEVHAERQRVDLAREAQQAYEQFAAAQERIMQLKNELADARQKKSEPATPDPSVHEELGESASTQSSEKTLASRLGFGPHQVLRRVDAAHRQGPGKTEEILQKALDLQNSDELILTEKLLRSMPFYVHSAFVNLVSKTARLNAILESSKTVMPPES